MGTGRMHLTKKHRKNKGMHVIISSEAHAELRLACQEGGANLSHVADTIILEAMQGLTRLPEMERMNAVKGMEQRYASRNPPVPRKRREVAHVEPVTNDQGVD